MRLLSPRAMMLLSAWFALGAVASATACAADAPTWKLQPGAKLRYRLTQTTETAINPAGGAGATLKSTMIFDTTWTVGEVPSDGPAQLTLSFDRVQMNIDSSALTVAYDSQSTDEPQGFAAMIAPTMRALVSGKYTMTMSPHGTIADVVVPDDVAQALAAAPGAQLLGEFGSAEGLRTAIANFLFEMPETLAAGDEWTRTVETPNPILGVQTVESTFRYVGPREREGVALEEFTGKHLFSYGGEGAVTVTINKQDAASEILFDRTAGRLESAAVEQTLDLTLAGGNREMNQSITLTMKLEWKGGE